MKRDNAANMLPTYHDPFADCFASFKPAQAQQRKPVAKRAHVEGDRIVDLAARAAMNAIRGERLGVVR